MTQALSLLAPAKLNLFLHVTGRRPDGYHLLQTVFRFVDACDTITLRLRGDGQILRRTDLPGVSEQHDLCLRAARALQQASGCQAGVELELDKQLPMGGGLGGGSSDAATVLLGLNRLWGLGWSRSQLQGLGLTLGADVPVFIFGRNAFAEGVGEQLQPVDLPPAWYVVLCPPVHVSTAEVFAAKDLTRDTKPVKMAAFSAGYGQNDLQAVVCGRHPEVAEYLAWLSQQADARMTGSGACVFAGFDGRERAESVFAQRPPGFGGFVARGLDEHPHRGFAE